MSRPRRFITRGGAGDGWHALARRLRPSLSRREWLRLLAGFAGWLAIAVPASYLFFMNDSRATVIAGHDVVVHPTHDGYATLDMGAYIPDLRYPTGHVVGVRLVVGKTTVDTYESLLQRYALILSSPEGEIDKVADVLSEMLVASLLKGALVGLAGPGLWLLVGARRRSELRHTLTRRRVGYVVIGAATVVLVAAAAPYVDGSRSESVATDTWEPLSDYLTETSIPQQARPVEVQRGLITSGTQRLIESAFTSYRDSLTIYHSLAVRAADLEPQLHQPADDETVALFVTDRHDNIGMDAVAKAIGDAGGATILFDGGDDTSTGEPWESFSLDSLTKTFEEYNERYEVNGNHDNGNFVTDYLSDRGFTILDGEPVMTDQGDIRLLGVPDPRSSGLGSWKTESGITFEDQADRLADIACAADADGKRVATLLVHDANLARPALDRGCVDLVLAGHVHTQIGPDVVEGANGAEGVTFTNGTTGGAAYAVAVGTKLRRDAQVSLITYRDGRPVGIQPVSISTTNVFTVENYFALPTPPPEFTAN